MKKVLVILFAVCLAAAMVACSTAPYTCDYCLQEKTSKKHITEVLGEKVTICDECYEGLNALSTLLGG